MRFMLGFTSSSQVFGNVQGFPAHVAETLRVTVSCKMHVKPSYQSPDHTVSPQVAEAHSMATQFAPRIVLAPVSKSPHLAQSLRYGRSKHGGDLHLRARRREGVCSRSPRVQSTPEHEVSVLKGFCIRTVVLAHYGWG